MANKKGGKTNSKNGAMSDTSKGASASSSNGKNGKNGKQEQPTKSQTSVKSSSSQKSAPRVSEKKEVNTAPKTVEELPTRDSPEYSDADSQKFESGDHFPIKVPSVYSDDYSHDTSKRSIDFPSLDKDNDFRRSNFSLNGDNDAFKLKNEIRVLKSQLKQAQEAKNAEQDTVLQLRRKVTTVERERLEENVKLNDETIQLQSQITSLRCQIERTESENQNLKFEVSRSKRDGQNEKRMMEENLLSMNARNQDISAEKDSLSQKMNELNEQMYKNQDEIRNLDNQLLQAKEDMCKGMMTTKTEMELVVNDRERMESLITEKDMLITDMNDRILGMQEELGLQAETIRRQVNDLEYYREREERTKADYQTVSQRTKTLDEAIEAERAAHLESKFNSEIIQLRVRDLEAALDTENQSRTEVAMSVDALSRQLREMERAYEDEKQMHLSARSGLDDLTEEHNAIKSKLTNDLAEKRAVILNLSKQLELHEKDFSELKQELSRTKKRQVYLEETYGGSMRELELLLENFSIAANDGNGRKKKKEKVDPSSGLKAVSPAVVLENLRHTLMEYKKRLNYTSEELEKMKQQQKSLSKECDSYREMMNTKDKALEDTQTGYSQTGRELNQARSRIIELETEASALRLGLETESHGHHNEKIKANEFGSELSKLARNFKDDEEDKINFLHSLYQKMLSGNPTDASSRRVDGFSWFDLSSMINDQVSGLLNTVHRDEEKIIHLESVLESKEKMMQQIQNAHDDQLRKLDDLSQDREGAWLRQKRDLEEHYGKLLTEVHSRSKKSHVLADQAWERLRSAGNIQLGLEAECSELTEENEKLNKENKAILSAFALLLGAFYPLYTRYNELAVQRSLLEEQVSQLEFLRRQAVILSDTMTAEMDDNGQISVQPRTTHLPSFSPIFRFRIAVLSVMAANRLTYFGKNSCRMFTSFDLSTGINGMAVKAGNTQVYERLTGVGFVPNDADKNRTTHGQESISSWLTNPALKNNIVNSTSELIAALDDNEYDDPKVLVSAARNAFARIMDKMAMFYEGADQDICSFREKKSLFKQLGDGLHKALVYYKATSKSEVPNSQEVMSSIQHNILGLTKKYQNCEMARRELKNQLNAAREECTANKGTAHKAKELESQVNSLRSEYQNMVDIERFSRVCKELNSALRREEQAQSLLNEQNMRLQELQSQLELLQSAVSDKETNLQKVMGAFNEKEMNLKKTLTTLDSDKNSLKKKDDSIRHLNQQVSQLEEDNKELLHNIKDAENALKTAAKDRDVLAEYMRNVESVLDAVKQKLALSKRVSNRDTAVSKQLLSPSLIPVNVGKSAQEFLRCQNLVAAFVDTQHILFNKFHALEDNLSQYEKHISSLKRELAAVCQREIDINEPPTNEGGKTRHSLQRPHTDGEGSVALSAAEHRSPSQFKSPKESRSDESAFHSPPTRHKKMEGKK